jgi:hypothetical protein
MGRRTSKEELEYWRQRIEQYEVSGQTREAYCSEQGIKVHTLDYWRRKITQPSAEKPSIENWIPVKIIEEEAASIELRVGKVHIAVRSGFSRELLREVLQVLAV